MKRPASIALVLALCSALALSGAVVAKEHSTHPGQGGGPGAASLKVKGNASHPGGVFRVLAVLHAAKDQRPQTIDAVVHFATGDIAVVLMQSGKGAAYHGNVPVPASEPSGIVKIDATAVVNGVTVTATGSGKIIAKTDHETTETSTTSTESGATSTETTATSTETTTTCTVTTTETVTSTVTSTATETSTSTDTTATDESEDSESSDADETSETSESSETEDADCDDDLTNAPAIVLTPQSLRQIVAYLVALLDRS